MNPAEELRAAAARMRELAEKASPGEWVAATGRGRLGVVGVFGPDGPGSGFAVAVSATPGTAKAANAEHIAAWQPRRALAVATLLEGIAERHTFYSAPTGGDDYYTACRACGHENDDDLCPDICAALAVARAFMGGEQR